MNAVTTSAGQVRVGLPGRGEQLGAAEPRHSHVGDQRRVAPGLQPAERRAGVQLHVHLGPAGLEDLRQVLGERLVVIHHQVPSRSPGHDATPGNVSTNRAPRVGGVTCPIVPPCRSAMRFTSASPRPTPLGLVVIERLEEPGLHGGVEPVPGVLDGDLHLPVRAPGLHRHPAGGVAAGLDRVLDQVDEDLPELGSVAHHQDPVEGPHLHRHAAGPRNEVHCPGHDLGEDQRLGVHRPVADQIEQRAHDAVGQRDLLADALEVLPRAGVRPHPLLQEEHRRLGHPERVPQLVADAGHHLAEGGQPLGREPSAPPGPRGRSGA